MPLTHESILVLFGDLAPLKLKSSPRRSEIESIASLWLESFAGRSLEELRRAAFLHLKTESGRFFPQIAEVSSHMPAASEEEPALVPGCYVLAPVSSEEASELNPIAARCRPDEYSDRIVRPFIGRDASPSDLMTGSELLDRLSGVEGIDTYARVIESARIRLHAGAIAIRIPYRPQALEAADRFLPSIAAALSCRAVIYSD